MDSRPSNITWANGSDVDAQGVSVGGTPTLSGQNKKR